MMWDNLTSSVKQGLTRNRATSDTAQARRALKGRTETATAIISYMYLYGHVHEDIVLLRSSALCVPCAPDDLLARVSWRCNK
eukprot:scaffold209697_cov42-Prasinocladus_malaysianus.AAC.1